MNTPQLAVSSWSLNRTLGAPQFDALLKQVKREPAPDALALLELPRAISEFGIQRLELCHFHLPDASHKYLHELKSALDAAHVELWDFLIDDGDITHPDDGPRWLDWTRQYIDIAAQLGARHVRIIAGRQNSTPDNLQLSRHRLQELAQHAKAQNVRVLTENWFALLDEPQDVIWLLDELNGAVGLNFDLGNWPAPRKYDDLPLIAPYAESCHAKCRFDGGQPDADDYRRCLAMLKNVDFAGSFSLIYDGSDADEWKFLDIERQIVREFL